MPTFELNRAMMWPGAVGARSRPAILFASATTYQVFGSGAFVKPCTLVEGPAAPSVPVAAVQSRGSKVALMRISTSLSIRAPQSSAAFWKALNRCWPIVVPVLPPTGVAGVASLNPTPAALALTIVMRAAAASGAAPRAHSRRADAKRRDRTSYFFTAAGAGGVACGTHVVFVDPSGSVSMRTSNRNASPRSTTCIPSG